MKLSLVTAALAITLRWVQAAHDHAQPLMNLLNAIEKTFGCSKNDCIEIAWLHYEEASRPNKDDFGYRRKWLEVNVLKSHGRNLDQYEKFAGELRARVTQDLMMVALLKTKTINSKIPYNTDDKIVNLYLHGFRELQCNWVVNESETCGGLFCEPFQIKENSQDVWKIRCDKCGDYSKQISWEDFRESMYVSFEKLIGASELQKWYRSSNKPSRSKPKKHQPRPKRGQTKTQSLDKVMQPWFGVEDEEPKHFVNFGRAPARPPKCPLSLGEQQRLRALSEKIKPLSTSEENERWAYLRKLFADETWRMQYWCQPNVYASPRKLPPPAYHTVDYVRNADRLNRMSASDRKTQAFQKRGRDYQNDPNYRITEPKEAKDKMIPLDELKEKRALANQSQFSLPFNYYENQNRALKEKFDKLDGSQIVTERESNEMYEYFTNPKRFPTENLVGQMYHIPGIYFGKRTARTIPQPTSSERFHWMKRKPDTNQQELSNEASDEFKPPPLPEWSNAIVLELDPAIETAPNGDCRGDSPKIDDEKTMSHIPMNPSNL